MTGGGTIRISIFPGSHRATDGLCIYLCLFFMYVLQNYHMGI